MIAQFGGILSAVALLAAGVGDDEPYVARPLTQLGAFTRGIEGPACDLEGNTDTSTAN